MINKKYRTPIPIVNNRELKSLDLLTERYNDMIKPGTIEKIGTKAKALVPSKVKSLGNGISLKLSSSQVNDIYANAMKQITEGFGVVEKYASKYTINEKKIIENINKVSKRNVDYIEEICLLRSYDISKAVNSSKNKEILAAMLEGGATGAAGFAGLPFNLVLSTLLYFRAVQSIAMYYGFDVKNDTSELIIAGEVFVSALNPVKNDINNEINGIIGKVMVMTQANIVKQTATKTWTDMATKGGVPLLLTQMRALAHKSAQKALQNAGAKGLENSVFKQVFEQIGRKLTLKTIQKAVPVASAVLGALIDTAQMNKVLEYADIFYQKRFIMEKKSRISMLKEQESEGI